MERLLVARIRSDHALADPTWKCEFEPGGALAPGIERWMSQAVGDTRAIWFLAEHFNRRADYAIRLRRS